MNSNAWMCGHCDMPAPSGTYHVCQPAAPFALPSWVNDRLTCLHCWCVADGAGSRMVDGVLLYVKEPHEVCCSCGSRRVKVQP